MLPVQVLAEEFVEEQQVQETTAPAEPEETEAPAETEVPTKPAATEAPTEPAATEAPTEPAATEAPTEPEATEEPEADFAAVSAVVITATDNCVELTVGQTLQLTAAIEPENATEQTVLWESEDETIATVDETGLVTAVAAGEVTITAAAGGVEGSFSLAVTTAKTEIHEQSGVITDIPAGAAVSADSGSCGANVTYSFDGTVLTISGTGPMYDGVGNWITYADQVCVVEMEEGVTTIGKQSFYGLSNLVLVTLPRGITSIGDSAFAECRELVHIEIPNTVASIGEYAFENCGIQALTLNEGLASIGKNAFAYCSKLTAVTIPESVTTMGAKAFYGCNSNMVITCGNFAAPAGWDSTWNHYAAGKPLATTFREATSADLFWASVDPSMESLKIPGYVTEIPAEAFKGYTALKQVTICEGVTTIGAKAFEGCTALWHVTIPASVTTIAGQWEKGPFYGCSENLVIYCTAETEPSGWGEYWNCVLGEWECETYFGNDRIAEHYWASLDKTAAHVVIPEGITSIPENAFFDCNIESVVIPDSVTTIEAYAFNSCGYLTSVQFGSGVEYIGQSAFANTAITELNLPEGLTTVERYAFSGCNSLKKVTLPKSLTKLPNNMFSGCGALEWIDLPDTLTTIGANAFQSTGLKAIFIPESVTTISASDSSDSPFLSSTYVTIFCERDAKASGWGTYWNNISSSGKATYYYNTTRKDAEFWSTVDKDAETITIPEGVTMIPNGAFSYKTNLKNITLPDTLTHIGSYAFSGCTGLTSIYIPESVTTIPTSDTNYSPFLQCAYDLKIYCGAAGKPSGWGSYWNLYKTGSSNSYLSASYGYSRQDYQYWSTLDKTQEIITIPEGITLIPANAFDGNTTLKQITIPGTVTTIGGYAFRNCTALTKVKLGEGLKDIGGYAFSGCSALESMPLPEGVTEIGMYAFSACTALTDVSIPSTVTVIGREAFYNCGTMDLVYISDIAAWCAISFGTNTSNPLSNGAVMFVGGYPLTELTIPETVTKLETNAFTGCENLKKLTIPATVTTIGGYAFSGCTGLEEVYYHAATDNVGIYVFRGCTALRKVEMGSGMTVLPSSTFSGCSALTEITLPDTLVEIRSSALSGCSALTGVALPDTLETIGNNAFSNCTALQSILIPASVTTISASGKSTGPFYGCTKLAIFTSLAAAPSGWGTYWNNYSDSGKVTVHYNAVGSESEYWGSIDMTAETVEIPEGITRIPDGIFKNNTNMKRVVIPSTVSVIEANAFYGCTGLTELTIPETVTTLGEFAFYGCTGLTEVTVPGSITTIPASCFYGCTGLKRVILSDGVTTISAKAFGGCTVLEGIYFPSSVINIAGDNYVNSPFYNCKSVLRIYCTATEKQKDWGAFWCHIGSSSTAKTFYGVSRMDAEHWIKLDRTQSVLTIPDSVTMVPEGIFQSNSTLTKVVLGTGVKSVGEYAFSGCNALTFAYVPATVETIGDYAFNSSNITIYTDADSESMGWSSCWNHRNLSTEHPTVYGVTLQEAEYWASLDKTQTAISIPAYITSLPDNAFSGCSALTFISLPNGLKTIGSKAFYNCTGLQGLDIPTSVTAVAADAFTGSGLESITYDGTMEQWVKVHPANSIKVNCTDDTIYISGSCGENVSYILTNAGVLRITGTGAMKDFYSSGSNTPGWYGSRDRIKEVRISEGVTSVGERAFFSCKTLTTVKLPNSLLSIGAEAFYGCDAIPELPLPDNLTTIGVNAFYGMKIKSMVIPASVTELGNSTFNGCSALETVIFLGNGIKEFPGSLFNNCAKLKNITIPDGVTTIGSNAFNGCAVLTEIRVPEGVTTIGGSAFWGCTEMVSIQLPSTLQSIGSHCFGGSTTADLYFAGTMEQWVAANGSNTDKRKAVCADGTIITWGAFGDNHTYTITEDGIFTLKGTGPVPDTSDKVSTPWSGYLSYVKEAVLPEDIPNIGRRMFDGCSYLTSITIPATVTEIGELAFRNCGAVTITYNGTSDQWLAMSPDNTTGKAVICTDQTILRSGSCGEDLRYLLTGDGNMTITGNGAMTDYPASNNTPWYACRSSICNINIGSGVTCVGNYSFYDCDNLTTVTMADSVTTIGDNAFRDCDTMTSIAIGNGVTTIGENAFYGCGMLSEITIPASVTAIKANAFSYCDSLNRVNISDLGAWCGITFGSSSANPAYYAEGLYMDGQLLEKIVIPEGTTAIGSYAFENCAALTELTIPGSVTTIGEKAFYNCVCLKQINYGDTVERWLAYYPDNECRIVCTDDTIVRSGKCGDTAHYVLLESGLLAINGTGTVTNRRWEDNREIVQDVIIAPGITEIGNYIFANLTNMTSVSIPEGVVSIGREAFHNCPALEMVTIPASVQTIGDYAFRSCEALQTINFEHVAGDTLSIGNQAFYYPGSIGPGGYRTTVGVPYARVVNETIRNFSWMMCNRRPEYVSTRSLPADAITIEPMDGITVIEAGLDMSLNVRFFPAESTSEVMWSILEDESTGTATVNEYGFFTALTPGIVTVQAQTNDSGVTAEIAITIEPPTAEAEGVDVYVADSNNNEAEVGTIVQMVADIIPGNTVNKSVTWSVENGTGTAAIDEDGYLKALTTGTVTVYAETAYEGVVGSARVNIVRYVEGFAFTFNGMEAPWVSAVGERMHIAATPIPADASQPHPEWEIVGGTANVSFRTLNEGGLEITGKTAGTVTVVARSMDTKGYETAFELTFSEDVGGAYALSGGGKLLYNTETGLITGVEGAVGDVTIPGRIGDTVITGIAPYAFVTRSSSSANGNQDLKSLVIPASVKTIGDYAFYNCDNLVSVRFEGQSALETIGDYAFGSCDGLATVIYTGTGLQTIGDYAFYDCDVLSGMTFPAGIQQIGRGAFQNCDSIQSLTIPDGLTDIGEAAFWMDGLKELTMRGDLDSRKWMSWLLLDKLTLTGTTVIGFVHEGENWVRLPGREAKTVILSDSVTRIEAETFADINQMTSVTLSSNLTHIANDAFRGCRGLTAVELPDGLEYLGDYAFSCCENLTELNIPVSVTTIGRGCFMECRKLQLIDLSAVPDLVETELNITDLAVLPDWLVRCASEHLETHWELWTVEGQPDCYEIADWYGNQYGEWLRPKSTGIILLCYRDEYTGAQGSKEIFVQAGNMISADMGNKMGTGESKQLYLVNANGESVPANWFLREQDLAYASISEKGLLKAKTVDRVREIMVTAVPKDGSESASMIIYVMPKAAKVLIYTDDGLVGESGTSVQTLTVDMRELPQMLLRAASEPEDASPNVKWSSSAPSVVEVDEGGVLSFWKPGSATIKATAAGTTVSASVKINVVYVESTKTLTASAAVPAIGLQPGQSTRMQVFGADKTEPLDPGMFEYSISSAQQEMATVDEYGMITAGEKAGTVTVTAALANDPLSRKVTVKVKVIPMQTQRIELYPAPHPDGELQKLDENGEKWLLILDEEEMGNGIGFQLDAVGYDYANQPMFPVIKWATTDKTVAKVETHENGETYAIVMPNATGSCTLQAKASDLTGAIAELIIQVRDYSPRMESNTFTVNSFHGGMVSAALVESYNNKILGAQLFEQDELEQWVESTELNVQAEQGQLKISTNGVLTAGKRTLQLRLTCENGRTYTYPVTVTVANKLPTVTVKQKEKFNLFYTGSAAAFTITAKDAVVADVRLAEHPAFTMEMEDGVPVLRYTDAFKEAPAAAVNKKAVVEVYLEGYEVPVTKSITISTVTTKPKLTMTPSSSVINTELGDEHTTLVRVYNATAGQWLFMEECLQSVQASFADSSFQEDGLLLTLNDTTGGTATIMVQAEGWTQPVKLSHKISVLKTNPTVKLSTTTLKLNRILAENTASTTVMLSQSNLLLQDLEIVSTAAEGTATWEQAQKLDVTYDPAEGTILAQIIDPDDAPKAGTYTFSCIGTLTGGQTLKKVTLKVSVSGTAPKVKLKQSTLKLNTRLTGSEIAATTATITGATDYVLVGFSQLDNWTNEDVNLYVEDGMVKAELTNDEAAIKRHTFKLNPVLENVETGRQITLSSAITLYVSVYNSSKISVTLSTKGKLDTLNPDSAIVYTVTKMSNIVGEVEGVSLAGPDADLFHVELIEGGSKPQAALTLLPGQDYATNVTYKVQLDFLICGQNVLSKALSFRVTQSKLKVTAPKSVTLFLSQTAPLEIPLQVAAPAEIFDVTIGSKTTAALKAALEEEVNLNENGSVLLRIGNVSNLVKGKSYTVYLAVTPENNAENVAPTQVKVTVKVKN